MTVRTICFIKDLMFQSFCRAYNSRLASIETRAENNFLADVITRIKQGISKRGNHGIDCKYIYFHTDVVHIVLLQINLTNKDLKDSTNLVFIAHCLKNRSFICQEKLNEYHVSSEQNKMCNTYTNDTNEV